MGKQLGPPLTGVSDLQNEISWSQYKTDFSYAGKFVHTCTVKPVAADEEFQVLRTYQLMKSPCLCAMVVDGKVFKFGDALRGVESRISSYNTGKQKHVGDNSNTNYWVLQSMLNIGMKIRFYAFFVKNAKITCPLTGISRTSPVYAPKELKSNVLKEFKKHYGRLPIGNKRG